MYKYNQYNNGNLVKELEFASRKEAREYLNKVVKEIKSNNKELRTYFQESNNFYSVKDLRLASDIEKEENGLIDLGDVEPTFYFEITEIEDI